MNGLDFSQYRHEPRSEFAESLYERISKAEVRPERIRSLLQWASSGRGLAVSITLAILILGACARRVLTPRTVRVGDHWVVEMSAGYICAGDPVYPSYTPLGPMPTPQPPPQVEPPPRINLEQLKSLTDFDLRIPSYAPTGFKLQGDFPPPSPYAFHSINWLGPDRAIGMWAFPREDWPTGREIRLLRGEWEEVEVNGQPAVLVHGQCWGALQPVTASGEIEFSWNSDIQRLAWSEPDAYYELFAEGVDPEDLIRMAESAH